MSAAERHERISGIIVCMVCAGFRLIVVLLLPRLGEGQEGRHTQRSALDKCWCFLRCHLRTVSRFARSLHLGSSVCERCGEAGAHIRNRRLHGLCWFSGRESCCCCRVWEKDRKGDIRKGVRWTSVDVSCDIISAPFHALQGACIWGVPYVSAAERQERISGIVVCMICAGFRPIVVLLLLHLGEGQEGRHTQRSALDKCWCFLRCHLRTVSRFARSLHLGSSVCERCGEAGAHIRNRRLHGLCWFSGRESCCCCRVWEKDRKGDIRKGVRWTSVDVSCDVISAPFHALQGACIWGVPYVSAAERHERISNHRLHDLCWFSGRSSCCCCGEARAHIKSSFAWFVLRPGEGREWRQTQRIALDKCWCFLQCRLRIVLHLARSLHPGSSVCERCGEAGKCKQRLIVRIIHDGCTADDYTLGATVGRKHRNGGARNG